MLYLKFEVRLWSCADKCKPHELLKKIVATSIYTLRSLLPQDIVTLTETNRNRSADEPRMLEGRDRKVGCRAPSDNLKHSDPTTHDFWYPTLSWTLESECQILMPTYDYTILDYTIL